MMIEKNATEYASILNSFFITAANLPLTLSLNWQIYLLMSVITTFWGLWGDAHDAYFLMGFVPQPILRSL